jgi:hypothetical protein
MVGARSKGLITKMLGTKTIDGEEITAEPLEKNSPCPAASSKLILLCLSSTQYPSIYRGD